MDLWVLYGEARATMTRQLTKQLECLLRDDLSSPQCKAFNCLFVQSVCSYFDAN